MRLDFSEESVPDATTLLKFRHLLEEHEITKTIFEIVKEELEANGKILHGGTVIDATIIEAPSAMRNKVPPRIAVTVETRKCIKRKKEMNGISG